MISIQIAIVLLFIVSILIGVIVGKKVKGLPENYIVAGRSFSALLVGFALIAQAIDGNATLGNTQLANDFGFWAGAALPIGLALSLFLLGAFFAEKLNSLKLDTIADLFERKYDKKIGLIVALILLFCFGILLAGNIATVGILLSGFFSINYETAVILSVLVVLIYIIRGGIISDIYSDLFHIALIAIGIFATLIYLVMTMGWVDFSAPSFALTQMTQNSSGSLINWATIIALGFGNLIAIDFATRIFSAKSPKEAKKGCYIGGILTLILGIPFSLLVYYISQSNITSSDSPIISAFALEHLPIIIAALLVVGIISAAISTIDGAILSMSNILTLNVLNIRSSQADTENKEIKNTVLYFLKLSLLPIAALSMIFALLIPSPGALISIAFDIAFAALLIPFIFAFSNKFNTSYAALYAIIAGAVSRMIFATLTPTVFGISNPFYINNNLIPPSLDGLGTIISPIIALIVYLFLMERKQVYADGR